MNTFEEKQVWHTSGWVALGCWLALTCMFSFLLLKDGVPRYVTGFGFKLLFFVFYSWLLLGGLKILKPNTATVFTFFGKYAGSLKDEGFWYVNPLNASDLISLKIINYSTPVLKVNDLHGTPVEIGAVISYSVEDTAKAKFAVEDVDHYVRQQCEAALRNLSAPYGYDGEGQTLRSNPDALATRLKQVITPVIESSGIHIHNASISHLAYAPEIAQSMLRVQQAKAVLEARRTIVTGAVSMVEDVIQSLKEKNEVIIDTKTAQQLTINLMTVLVSDKDGQPIIPLKD